MDNKIKNLITLAARSGNLVSGDDTCMIALKKGQVHLLILAEDASDNAKKKFTDKATYRNIPIRYWQKKEELGSIIGKETRTIIGIVDQGFSEKLMSYIDELSK